MYTALIVVEPAVIVGSVHADAASPFRVLAAFTAVRTSLMCTAFSTVLPATSGLSVKPPEPVTVSVALPSRLKVGVALVCCQT